MRTSNAWGSPLDLAVRTRGAGAEDFWVREDTRALPLLAREGVGLRVAMRQK